MSFAVYLSHPQVVIDPAVPVPEWGLSELGRRRTVAGLAQPWAATIRHVVSSGETKAVETAEIFARHRGVAVRIEPDMHENDRSATGFLPPPEFEVMADRFFATPEESIRGWERAVDAQARIVAAVERVLATIPGDEPVLFCGHGGVGTLLMCQLAGMPIARSRDQAPGGGNWFRFLKSRGAVSAWRSLEQIALG